MRDKHMFIPVKDIETSTRISKEARIKGLQPKFQAHKVYIKKEHKDLYQQLVMFPQLAHDDLLDALKTQLSIAFNCDQKDPIEEKKDGFNPFEREIKARLKELGNRRVIMREDIEL